MKKFLSLAFVAVLLVSMVTASALADVNVKTINMNVQCKNTTDLTYDTMPNVLCWIAGRMYVYHYATNASNEYTNLYHVVNQQMVLKGQKWCTPYVDVPVQSNAILYWETYTVAARGNTKHYDLDGLQRITLSTTISGKGKNASY